jgi:uncharacterized membrane protein YphA (DoxX/SURF4 family)
MTLKSQDTRLYRGLIWVGRLYRFAGWIGLGVTILFTIWGFFNQWSNMTRWGDDPFLWELVTQSLLAAGLCAIIGLFLSAIAFGISLGIQVGLTMMKNSNTQVALLRRIAQQQGEADSVLRLDEGFSTNGALSEVEQSQAAQRETQRTSL